MSIHVTDHAAIRYCERVLGFDRAALAKAMTELTGGMPGRHKLPGHDVVAVVENGSIITFVPATYAKPPKKTKPKKMRPIRDHAP